MGRLTIRSMTAGEAGQVAALLIRANEEHLATFPAEVASAYRVELADMGARRFADVYVAHLPGGLVGSVTYLSDAALDGHPWPPGGAVLRFLAVEPSLRGQGVGERLTTTCIDRARTAGARFLGLHTAPVMADARRLYERLGFQRAPEHDFDPAAHYGGATAAPDDALWGLAYVLRLD